jgi:hypothetical protein
VSGTETGLDLVGAEGGSRPIPDIVPWECTSQEHDHERALITYVAFLQHKESLAMALHIRYRQPPLQ